MTSAQLINQTSGNCEKYSPPEIIEAARATMGGIDLDPASSMLANERVKAEFYFDESDDGLLREWHYNMRPARVFMNHPFGRKRNAAWINKLIAEYESGRVSQACCITYACTSEAWFTPLLQRPQCFLIPRTNYYLPNGKEMRGVTKGSVVTYFGRELQKFATAFWSLGVVKIAWTDAA
jgi:ParB family chromosome partitioning protein